MTHLRKLNGFSLVELLLVLAIIGIISAIAIPSLSGQRLRARKIGDAQVNSKALSMMLESRKAETGIYGTAGAVARWDPNPNVAATALALPFTPAGNSQMSFTLTIGTPALTYDLSVTDQGNSTVIYHTNQTGATLTP